MKPSKSTISILIILALVVITAAVLLIKNNENPEQPISTVPNSESSQSSSVEKQPAAQLLEEIDFPSNGSVRLEITQSDVAIGFAEGFQDALESSNTPFTIFVIYGPVNADVTMFNGRWKVWGNADASFIQNEIDAQIASLKDGFLDKVTTRGYRVVECHEQVDDCTTLLSAP